MGTNRQPQNGCQLVEALSLYDSYISKGKIPPETKHSFTIPAEWIRALDPRIKKRIKKDTHKEFTVKADKERRKLEKKLKKQLKDSKIDQQQLASRLSQHDEIWQSKTLNEIAKRIEKAHLYSFNLGNYRSNLSAQQVEKWNQFFPDDKNHGEQISLDEKFDQLQKCSPEKAHDTLAYFDIQNGLEFDIVRQYLGGFSSDKLKKFNQLAELHEIIESGSKYPRVKLGEYLIKNTDKIKPQNFPETRFRVLGVSNTDGIFLNETKYGKEIKQAYYRVKQREFCYNPYRVNVGSIGLNEFDYDNQIISGAYNVFGTDESELIPEYLMALFGSPQFLEYVNDKAHGGVRMNFKYEYLEDWEIPLPDLAVQERIAQKYVRLTRIKQAFKTIFVNFQLNIPELLTSDRERLGKAVVSTQNGWSPNCNGGDTPVLTLACLKNGSIDLTARKWTDLNRDDIDRFFVKEGDFFYSRGNTPELVALAGIASNVDENIVFPDLLTRVEFDTELILPQYAVILFNSTLGRKYFGNVPLGASPSMVKVSQKYMKNFPVPFLGNINMQKKIINKSQELLGAVESLLLLKKNAQETLKIISTEIWE